MMPPLILVYASCTCCRIFRLVPLTHPGVRGERWQCCFCSNATGAWLEREMSKP